MIISLIGMSGTGKTHWAKKLINHGFLHLSCDDLIEKKLEPELSKYGYKGLEDVGRWMGQPYEPSYKDASKKYLEKEGEVVEEILDHIQTVPNGTDIVIDTTGSVVYLQEKILNKLKLWTTVIYLEVPKQVEKEIYNMYLLHPKPVIWGDSFKKRDHETNAQALARCYPDLLKFRKKRYEKLADMTIYYHSLRKGTFGSHDFLRLIE